MSTISERLRAWESLEANEEAQMLTEAADAIDELVKALKYFVECEAENIGQERFLRNQYPHIMSKYNSEMLPVIVARALVYKHNGDTEQ